MCTNLYSNIIPANKVKIRMMTYVINIFVILSIFPITSIDRGVGVKEVETQAENNTFRIRKISYYP